MCVTLLALVVDIFPGNMWVAKRSYVAKVISPVLIEARMEALTKRSDWRRTGDLLLRYNQMLKCLVGTTSTILTGMGLIDLH
jgi:hypothetical protein